MLTRIWAAQLPRMVRPLAGSATVNRASRSPCIARHLHFATTECHLRCTACLTSFTSVAKRQFQLASPCRPSGRFFSYGVAASCKWPAFAAQVIMGCDRMRGLPDCWLSRKCVLGRAGLAYPQSSRHPCCHASRCPLCAHLHGHHAC